MIKSVIQAGFGNQLFQYATAYALAKELGQELELDVSWFEYIQKNQGASVRENNLNKLSLDTPKFAGRAKNFLAYRFRVKFGFPKKIQVHGKKCPFICENVNTCREDQSYLFQNVGANGAVLYGFWQNLNYFDKYLLDLKRQFVPNYALEEESAKLLQQIRATNSVGVHIRRGDFVSLGWNKGQEYYDKGLEWFKKQFSDCKFFIVSDDVQWVKDRYGNREDVVIVDVNTPTKDIDEFFLLENCGHQLISESTFGWWAAYLNTNPDKKVLAPKEAKGNIFDLGWERL